MDGYPTSYNNVGLVNATVCDGVSVVESTIYRKVAGTILFVIVWPFIVLDIKLFPLGRPASALLGATVMVIFIVVPQDQVYLILGKQGNLQTLCLLVGMMILSYYYDREGMLHVIALWIFGKNKPFRHVLWKVCTLSAVLSAIITNDATCLIITPLLLAEHMKQKRSPKEYPSLLIGIATSANIGSAATFFGNPQNAFIAANSNGQVSLLIFFATALPAAILGLACSVGLLYIFYFKTACSRENDTSVVDVATEMLSSSDGQGSFIVSRSETATQDLTLTAMTVTSLADSRRDLTLSYDRSIDPYNDGQLAEERATHYKYLETYPGSRSSSYNRVRSHPFEARHNRVQSPQHMFFSPQYGTTRNYRQVLRNNVTASAPRPRPQGHSLDMSIDSTTLQSELSPQQNGENEVQSTWKKRVFCTWLILATLVLVALLAIPPPPSVAAEFNLGLVPVGIAVFTMVVDTVINRRYAFDAMMKIDWTVILMFIGLFIWLGGFENTNFPSLAFDFIRPYMDLFTVRGVLLFMAFVIIGSNILSNVPLVILIVDQLNNFYCSQEDEDEYEQYCSAQLVGVLLAWVSTIAGNFTLIGSVANLIVAEKARNVAGYRLTFWEYFKFGLCSTAIVLLVGTPIVYFAGKNVQF